MQAITEQAATATALLGTFNDEQIAERTGLSFEEIVGLRALKATAPAMMARSARAAAEPASERGQR